MAGSGQAHLPQMSPAPPAPAPSISEVIATVTLTATNRNTDQYPELMPRSAPGSRKGLMLGGAWRWPGPDILTALATVTPSELR